MTDSLPDTICPGHHSVAQMAPFKAVHRWVRWYRDEGLDGLAAQVVIRLR